MVAVRNGSTAHLQAEESLLEGDPRWEAALRLVQSSQLSRAAQLQSILLFIMRQAILQLDEQLHEFDIAYRIPGRNSNFNPPDDNIVRVQVARLRKKLDLYFSTEGRHEPLVIAIALGTYMPVFTDRIENNAPHRLVHYVCSTLPNSRSNTQHKLRLSFGLSYRR